MVGVLKVRMAILKKIELQETNGTLGITLRIDWLCSMNFQMSILWRMCLPMLSLLLYIALLSISLNVNVKQRLPLLSSVRKPV